MLNWIKFFVLTSTFLFVSFGIGQVYFHDFGTTAISTHPYTDPPGVLDGNLSGSSWTNTTGAWTGFAGSSGQALSLSNSSGTPTITLELEVNSGCNLDLTSFSFWRRRSNSGAQNWSMSINGTTVGSGTVPTTGANTGNLPIVGQTGLTGIVTIEIELSGATGTGTFRLDDFRLDGSTSCGPPPTNPEPTNHPTNFGCTSVSSSEINLTWIDAIGAQLPDGYLIKWSDVSYAAIADPTDGSTANGANSVTVNYGAENVTITGLTPSTQYFFKIYPYTNSGAAIDYKIDGVIELTDCTTDTGPCVEESFTNNTAPGGTYSAGSYTGDSGSTWEYSQARSVTSTYNITGTSLGFSDNGTGYVSSTSSGGVGNITFSIRSYFTGGTAADRTIEVWVAGIFQGSFTLTSMGVIETHTISNINVSGAVLVEFRSVGSRQIVLDDVSWTCYSTSNTITTSTVSSATFNVDCSTGEAGTVGFTSSGEYNGGNLFTAELSDATGSFASPTSIGTLAASGTDPSGTINITIPAETASGTGYRIRVVSSDPVVTGSDNGANITINLSGGPCVLIPPHLTSVIINSCDSSCDEGQNELVFGNTGDYSILVNEANFNFSYTNSGPLNNYTDNLTNNASTTQDINDECPSTDPFIDAYGLTIPPNSSWVLANDAICPTDALDWTGLCNSGPIYIIYSTDPDWIVGGNFSNNPSSSNPLRPYQTSMTTTSGDTFTIDYETDGSLYPNDDGVFATFDYNGGSATSYGDDDCSFNVSVLPIELNSFIGSYNGKSTDLFWQTLSEQNNDYFALYHSTNGKMFERIGTVSGSGNTSTLLHYSFEHSAPRSGINYYKLKSVDYNGTVHDKGIISVLVEMNHVFYNQTTMSIQMNYESDYSVYGSDGRLVKRVTNQNTIPFTGKGIYHVIDERSGKSFKLGIW